MIQRYKLSGSDDFVKHYKGHIVLYTDHIAEIAKKSAEIADLTAELVWLDKIYNPCNHSPVESISCGVCGYPNPAKLIAALQARINELENLIPHYTVTEALDRKVAEIAALTEKIKELKGAMEKIIETVNVHEDKRLALFQVREMAKQAVGKQEGGKE